MSAKDATMRTKAATKKGKAATMSAKAVTMSAKAETMSAKAARVTARTRTPLSAAAAGSLPSANACRPKRVRRAIPSTPIAVASRKSTSSSTSR